MTKKVRPQASFRVFYPLLTVKLPDPLDPTTVMESRRFEVLTPMVKISVDPEFSSRIEARFFGGRKYLLIPADEGVEINGVACRIEISEE